MNRYRKYCYIALGVLLITVVFLLFYSYFLQTFETAGKQTKEEIRYTIEASRDFVETLTVYGGDFLAGSGFSEDAALYGLLAYDADTDSFHLDQIGRTDLEKTAGNLTGTGRIPENGPLKTELNLALSFNDHFARMYRKMPDITWLYYTSENRFINIYPWVSSAEFHYSDKLRSVDYYTVAMPQNDPLRKAVWTPVYWDEAGKGLMVSVSSPVYSGDTFMGVVSADLTTVRLNAMLHGKYASYLLDAGNSVIASGKKLRNDGRIRTLNDIMGSSAYSAKTAAIHSDTVQRIGADYIYKYSFEAAPWTLVLVSPLSVFLIKAFLCTFPMILICIILLRTVDEVERRKKAEEQIRSIAITDTLTELKNRYFLETILEKEFDAADRYNQTLSVILFDLDHFKIINDEWGHPFGDEVLKKIARIAESIVRKADILVRFGGEEFLILLPQTDMQGAFVTAEKIRETLEAAAHGPSVYCTASFGIAEREKAESFASLYGRVDQALYEAKEGGRNRVNRYGIEKGPLS